MSGKKTIGSHKNTWRTSAIAATAGYFCFPFILVLVGQLTESMPNSTPIFTRLSNVASNIIQVFIGELMGLAFFVGIMFWLLDRKSVV